MTWSDQGLQPLRRQAGCSLSQFRQAAHPCSHSSLAWRQSRIDKTSQGREERALQMVRSSEDSALSPADALVVDHYRSKQHWVEFNDDLLDDTAQGMDLAERSEAWSRVNKLFRNL